jgi:hypothetical protein
VCENMLKYIIMYIMWWKKITSKLKLEVCCDLRRSHASRAWWCGGGQPPALSGLKQIQILTLCNFSRHIHISR